MSLKRVIEGWLTEPYDYERPYRGQIRTGVILKVEERSLTLDIGLKRDGFVPRSDIERLDDAASSQLEPGQEVEARIVKLADEDGQFILSLSQVWLERDWTKAQAMLESGEICHQEVIGYNKGGLLVRFGQLRGFVPASHLLTSEGRQLSFAPRQRQAVLNKYVGQTLPFKVIEVNRDRHRLILSERLAREQMREETMERLLNELVEGQVCWGVVRRLCVFGAFVDLGGADGLIHISELSWRRVRHPREVLQEGDEIEVYILRLDHKRRRISLSLKRLQPSPWQLVDATYTVDQLVAGTVTNVVDFGAFVALDLGVEGLVHVSELADPPPTQPSEVVQRGDGLVLRILRIDSLSRRLGLSLKRVSAQERDAWLAQRAREQLVEAGEIGAASLVEEKHRDLSEQERRPRLVYPNRT
ncbi:MAG: 30S ribosomal protein S1 [Anaerolineae bacterium]